MARVRREIQQLGQFFVGLVIGAVFVLAGCGDEGAESSPPDSQSATSESTTSDASTSVAELTTTSSIATTTTSNSSTTEPTGPTVEVYYGVDDDPDCSAVQPFVRRLGDDNDRYRGTFQQLVAGPSAEETQAGTTSFFSSETAPVIKSANLIDGLLTVDFTDLRPLIPNASTSCGSEALLAQLNSTAFQFAPVERTRFLIEGSCDDFANWLQRECFDTDRAGRQLDVTINERASGAGCTPSSADTLPAGRWFGFVVDAQAERLSFDLACWFSGAAATAAAAEDGEESPPPNDYYIRNDSDRLRVHPVDSGTDVGWLPDPGDPQGAEVVTYETWLTGRATRTINPGVWLTVEDDSHVMKIEEQYVP